MTLYRNADGDLYFHQPMENRRRGEASIATWHVDLAGESYLRSLGIGEGDRLPFGEFLYLRDCGHLYTLETAATGHAGPQRERPRFDWGAAVGLRAPGKVAKPHQPAKRKKKNKAGKRPAQASPTRAKSSPPKSPQRQQRTAQATKASNQSNHQEWTISRETGLSSNGIHNIWTAEKPTSKKH